jgi:hypothetical protein
VARILAEYRRVTAERGVCVDRGRGTQGSAHAYGTECGRLSPAALKTC